MSLNVVSNSGALLKLKLEVFDVLRRHDLRRPQNHLAVGADLVLAEPAGLEGFSVFTVDLALRDALRRIISEVAEILDIPPDVLDLAGDDVLLDQRGGGETGQLDLADRASLLERPGRRRKSMPAGMMIPLRLGNASTRARACC